jgi:hypothetical protein
MAILLMFVCSTGAHADVKCFKKGKLRFAQSNEVTRTGYCWNSETSFFLSYECHLKRNCNAITSRPNAKLPTLDSKFGAPDSRFCLMSGGIPESAEYWDGGRWNKIDICKFSDHSFVSVDYMTRY